MSARATLQSILDAALAAVDPRAAVQRSLRLEGETLRVGDVSVDLSEVRRIWLLGAGKATARMAQGALAVLGDRVAGGSITVPDGAALPLAGVEIWEARHPLPDTRGLAGASDALRTARLAGEGDLVLCLLSGGASALWPAPPEGVPLRDLQTVTETLLRAGAPIAEVNTVRKHLSRLAGGQLARLAAPAGVLTLAISDVVGVPSDTIGSGPTLPDPTSFREAFEVLRRRSMHLPQGALRHLQAGLAGVLPDTVKPGELTNLLGFHVLLSVRDALEGAARTAEELGYRPRIVNDHLEGEASRVGHEIARAALRARDAGEGPLALLWGGETTVTVRGDGRGGRNQELALAAARVLEGEPGVVLASLGTDGRDGPTDAAGAMVDGDTVERGRAAGLDASGFLRNNDAYTYLGATGDLLLTGPSGTNVNDVIVALVDPL